MKIIEALRHKGKPFEIEGRSRTELPAFFKEMGFTVGAEIGVYKAEFTNLFCEQGLKMFAIDPWHSYAGAGRAAKDMKRQEFIYGHSKRVLAPYDNCTIIRKASMDAVHHFKDGSLDFVYIDGDHSFKHVAQDIQEWTWKVKKGGIVSGHDYIGTNVKAQKNINQVGPVIDAYVKAFNIKNFYILGRNSQRDDNALSWFWRR